MKRDSLFIRFIHTPDLPGLIFQMFKLDEGEQTYFNGDLLSIDDWDKFFKLEDGFVIPKRYYIPLRYERNFMVALKTAVDTYFLTNT